MPVYKTKDFVTALLRLGFRLDATHHNMFWYYIGDQKFSISTRTSHSEAEFGDSLLSARRRQLGNLTKAQMLSLLQGRLSPEEYRQHLTENGLINLTVEAEE